MKRNLIKGISLVLTLFLLFSFSGCGSQTTVAEKEEKDTIEIGFCFDSFVIERWHRERDIFVSAASELGAEVNVQNANGDIQEQIRQINYLIQKGVDVIVVVHVADDSLSIANALERANDAGIPVIAYDRLVLNSDVDLYISFDNEAVGRLMAEHMISHIGEGDVLMINGPLADNNVVQIEKGFHGVLEERGNPLTVTETYYAANWLAETGLYVTSDYLAGHEPPAGIMCGNDSIAGQAVKGLAEQRLAGQVCVVGQDADLDACQRIMEGTQCMTVYKPVEKLARKAAEFAVAMARGGMPEEVPDTIDNGFMDVPYCKLEPIAVTRDNMDEEITGKYHEAADIYLNVDQAEETDSADKQEAENDLTANTESVNEDSSQAEADEDKEIEASGTAEAEENDPGSSTVQDVSESAAQNQAIASGQA